MKVFISSLIGGMAPIRQAARAAVTTLGHEPIMAEDFAATAASPQTTCLDGVRKSEVVILILGVGYGADQASGLSATHEEYREARGRKPVLAFVQDNVQPEPRQIALLDEVQGWEGGLFRSSFTGPADLQTAITLALHRYEVASAAGPVDKDELVGRARALMPQERRGSYSGETSISIAIAGAPAQSIVRPIQLEDRALYDHLVQTALFGGSRIFDTAKGSQKRFEGAALVVDQGHRGASVSLNEQGTVLLRLPIPSPDERLGSLVLIEEHVTGVLMTGLRHASALLDHIDPTHRLSHVAVAAKITASSVLTWRTLAEHDASPGGIAMTMGNEERAPVSLTRSRGAFRVDLGPLVEDLMVPLRRQWKP
jgi:hypothetical protein